MTTPAWFKPKTRGYGAAPANWKGWALVGGYIGAMIILPYLLLLQPAVPGGATALSAKVAWALLTAAITIGFVVIARRNTVGGWKRRWGEKSRGGGLMGKTTMKQ